MSAFIDDAIAKWLQYQYHPPDKLDSKLQQILWFSSNLLTEGRPYVNKQLLNTNIIFVNDLTDSNSKIMSIQPSMHTTRIK